MDGLNLQFQCPLAVVVRSVCRSGTATTIPGIRLKKSILLPLVTSLTTSQDGRTRADGNRTKTGLSLQSPHSASGKPKIRGPLCPVFLDVKSIIG